MAQLANLTTTLALESASFVSGIEQSRGAVQRLLRQLDPAAAATVKYKKELDLLERGLKDGVLSTNLYAASIKRLNERFGANVSGASQVVRSSGAMRSGMQQLSFQIGDVSQGFAMGVSPMTIFAQQGGQVIQAMSLMTTEAKGLIGFLGGPWGQIMSAAVIVLGSIASAHFAAADGSKAEEAAAKDLKQAIDSLHQSTERQINSEERQRVAALSAANALYEKAKAARAAAIAELQSRVSLSKAALVGAQSGEPGSEGISLVLPSLEKRVAAQRALVKELTDQQAAARDTVANEHIIHMQALVSDSMTTSASATRAFQTALDKLNDQYKKTGDATAYKEGYAKLKKALDDSKVSTDAGTNSTKKHTAAQREDAAAAKEMAASMKLVGSAAKGVQSVIDDINKGFSKTFRASATQDWDAITKQASNLVKLDQDTALQNERKLQQTRMANVRDLAGLYSDLFTGGTKRLWRDFEDWGTHVISELLAKWTLNAVLGKSGGGGGGGLLGALTKLLGGGSTVDGGARAGAEAALSRFSFPRLPGLASGGDITFGGNSGIDRNILSLNGSPIARVGQGEVAKIRPAAANDGASFSFDLRGAVMTADLLAQMNQLADGAAVRGAAGGAAMAHSQSAKKARRRLA